MLEAAPRRDAEVPRQRRDAHAPHAFAAAGKAPVKPLGQETVGLQMQPAPGQFQFDQNDTDDRASAEFSEANLGDTRLVQRLVALARRLACSPQGSFPQSLKPAELKAAYRFFDNAQVDSNGILAPHIAQTLDRMSQAQVVRAVQDTTEFNLSHLSATEGLGYGTGNNPHGLLMHSLLDILPSP